MGLWFTDSFDDRDKKHLALKYKNPDNPHPELESISGQLFTTPSRTGRASFLGEINKWHGTNQKSVIQGIAFYLTTGNFTSTGTLIRQVSTEGALFYDIIYSLSDRTFIASGTNGIITSASVTFLTGWNFLEWEAELHEYTTSYNHRLRLNGTIVWDDSVLATFAGGDYYTTIYPYMNQLDDYHMIQTNGGVHTNFIGDVRIHSLKPIGNGIKNDWSKFPASVGAFVIPINDNYTRVDDDFPDDNETYLFDNIDREEESYKMKQIDPLLTNIFGFQYNNYCVTPIESFISPAITPSTPRSEIIPTLQHQYYKPDSTRIVGETFESQKLKPYEYRTSFVEFSFETVNGEYINDSRFGFRISSGAVPATRVSQFTIEIVTDGVVEEPDEPDPDVPTTPDKVIGLLSLKFTRLWKIELLDGTVFRFTSHNLELINPVDGLTYTPVDSLSMTAVQRKTGIDPTNSEALGIVSTAAGIKHDALYAGKLRRATITEYILDWQYPWSGTIDVRKQIIDSISFTGSRWVAEMVSIERKLLLPKGEIYGRTCRYILGDSSCKVDLDLLKQELILALAPTGKTRFSAAVSANFDAFGNDRSQNGYFDFGNVLFTGFPLSGLKHEVRSSTVPNANNPTLQDFILQVPTPIDIPAGVRFTIWPGCDKLYTTCKDKFENPVDGDVACGNTKNFGGFPTIPGADGVFAPITGAIRIPSGDFLDDPFLGRLLDFFINRFIF